MLLYSIMWQNVGNGYSNPGFLFTRWAPGVFWEILIYIEQDVRLLASYCSTINSLRAIASGLFLFFCHRSSLRVHPFSARSWTRARSHNHHPVSRTLWRVCWPSTRLSVHRANSRSWGDGYLHADHWPSPPPDLLGSCLISDSDKLIVANQYSCRFPPCWERKGAGNKGARSPSFNCSRSSGSVGFPLDDGMV